MANNIEDNEETWEIDWDAVIEKIEKDVQKYHAPRIFHDEILKSPMRF
jgi:hypothetical protein